MEKDLEKRLEKIEDEDKQDVIAMVRCKIGGKPWVFDFMNLKELINKLLELSLREDAELTSLSADFKYEGGKE